MKKAIDISLENVKKLALSTIKIQKLSLNIGMT